MQKQCLIFTKLDELYLFDLKAKLWICKKSPSLITCLNYLKRMEKIGMEHFLTYHTTILTTIFTDGWACSYVFGCTWFDIQTKMHESYKLDTIMSVYISELIAILQALKYINSKPHNLKSPILIISDSISEIKMINNLSFKTKINPIIEQILLEIYTSKKNISFLWVKGYARLK